MDAATSGRVEAMFGPRTGASVVGLDGLAGSSPVVLRLILGTELRRWREAAGISRETAAWTIRSSTAKVARMESGRVSFRLRDITDLLTLYGVVDDAKRAQFLTLAQQANEPGWWQQHYADLPGWFQTYLGLEQAASVIRTYDLLYVPGLLQTPAYAEAVARLAPTTAPARDVESQVERHVELSMQRQRVLLTQPEQPPRLWAVIDETVLHRLVGGRAVAREQLLHLMDTIRLPNVTLQITPAHFARHPPHCARFTFLRFEHFHVPDVVFAEHPNGALYFDKPREVDSYKYAIDRAAALLDDADPQNTAAVMLSRIYNYS